MKQATAEGWFDEAIASDYLDLAREVARWAVGA